MNREELKLYGLIAGGVLVFSLATVELESILRTIFSGMSEGVAIGISTLLVGAWTLALYLYIKHRVTTK